MSEHTEGPLHTPSLFDYPEHWTDAEEQEYQAYRRNVEQNSDAEEQELHLMSRRTWKHTRRMMEELREGLLDTIQQIDTPITRLNLELQPYQPLEHINVSVDLSSLEREETPPIDYTPIPDFTSEMEEGYRQYVVRQVDNMLPAMDRTRWYSEIYRPTSQTEEDRQADTVSVELPLLFTDTANRNQITFDRDLQAEFTQHLMEVQARRAEIEVFEEQRMDILTEMSEARDRLEELENHSPESLEEIVAIQHAIEQLEEAYHTHMQRGVETGLIETEEHEVIAEPEPTPTETVRVRRPNLLATGQITMTDAEPARILAEPVPMMDIDLGGARFYTDYSTTGITSSVSTSTLTWRPSKQYRFDTEKITNTVAIVRALQAVLEHYQISERDVQRLGLEDLVIEI